MPPVHPAKKTTQTATKPYAVLQVLPKLKEGGVEESTLAMARFLAQPRQQQTFKPHIAAAGGPRVAEMLKTGAKYHAMPLASKNPLVWLWSTYVLVQLIERENIALVHARSRACAWPARWAAWWCGVPFLTTFHGIYSTEGGYLKRFYNSVMVAGPLTIANSYFTAAHIAKTYKVKPENIIVAPRGLDFTQFNRSKVSLKKITQLRAALNIPEGTPLLLMVGRLTSWKGQHLLLEALSLLPSKKWVVAFAGGETGQGQYAADLKGFAQRLGLEDKVRWLGSRGDIPYLLAASTLAFSCSNRPEAFGRVAIEAQAMGVPIIASALGGSTETIIPNGPGQTGWLVPVAPQGGGVRPQALADCISRALRNKPKLATIGQAAAKHVRALYTERHMCQQEMAAYRRVLGLPQ